MTELPEGAEVESAIIWFDGLDIGHELYGEAILAGGFEGIEGDRRAAWPAAFEPQQQKPGEKHYRPRRVGVDVHRRCFVIEAPMGHVLVSITGANAALRIARIAIGEDVDGA